MRAEHNGKEMSPMERRYYNAQSLRHILDSFEERFGIDSDAFYSAHHADEESVRRVPRFHRHSWASFYREWRELSGEGFAASVKRELELV